MRRALCASGLLWAALALGAAEKEAPSAEWPGWRGPNRDGKSPDTGLLKQWPADGPALLWKVDDIGKGYSSVAVAGGLVYITGDAEGALRLFAFDLDGQEKWHVDVEPSWRGDHPGARATPTIDSGRLYLETAAGLVVCLDAKTGKKIWSKHLVKDFGGGVPGWGYAESVLIYHNLAIVKPGGRNCVVALEKATGATKWMSKGFDGGAEYSSCIALLYDGAHLVFTGTRAGLVCLSARTGNVLWSNAWSANNTANCPTPAFADGYVFWANGYGKGGICMKIAVGDRGVAARQAWTTRDMVCHHGGYVIEKGYIYGNHEGGWACLDLKTGKRLWSEQGVGKGSLCWADGMLYLFGEGGGQVGLATCSPQGMQMKGQFRVQGGGPSWAHPVVVGGRLYIRYDTNLYCFDVKGK
ncbi:MAG TPA: PQQ-binding-like beta-propeller repeat protein [Planctomycetota bacterium]|nr:PQQ-binding-like beta-propeller repeat protein [Planctomycetota bacterium]